MTYRTCEKLYDMFKPYIAHRNTSYKEALLDYKAVALVLRKLAFGQSDCNVGNELKWKEKMFSNIHNWFPRH
jgi:hypothetical protein